MPSCVHCGTENPPDSTFCSNCGKKVQGDAGAPAPAPKPGGQSSIAKTMISTPAPQAQQPAPQAPQSAPRTQQPAVPSDDKKTIFGMPAMAGMPEDPKVEPKLFKPPSTGSQPVQPASGKADGVGRTMIGQAPVTMPRPQQPAPQQPAQGAAPKVDGVGKTMIGQAPVTMPKPQQPAPQAQQPAPQSQQPAPQAQQPAPQSQQPAPQAQQPRVEQAPLATPGPMPAPQAQQAQQPAPQPQQPAPQAQQPAPQPQQQPASSMPPQEGQMAPASGAAPQTTQPRPRKSTLGSTTMMMLQKTTKMPKWLFFVIPLVLVLAAGAVVGTIYVKEKYLDPRAQVISVQQGDDFQSVEIQTEIANSGEGTKLVIKEQSFPVKGGKVNVILPVGPVVLGHNEIPAMLMDARDEEVGEVVLSFDMDKFWQPVLSGLEEDPPRVMVSFQTLPDTKVKIAGEAPGGTESGRYEWTKPVKELLDRAPPATGDKWPVEVSYEMTPKDGKAVSGTLAWEIPAVHLQVNRPADGAKVADDYVFCSGLTEPGTQVRVNGNSVGELVDNVFTVKVPLPTVGKHKIVVDAFNPKRGPKQAVLEVIRVESLDAEIDAYAEQVEKDLGWEALARDPDAFKGKKVALHGRIISFRTTKGVSAFQLLVDEGCPPEARCMLKVDFKGETNAGKDSWVTVLGEVTGKFTVETSDKKKFDVPALEAAFVVRDDDQGKKKKRRK